METEKARKQSRAFTGTGTGGRAGGTHSKQSKIIDVCLQISVTRLDMNV